jgi:hypothetical protein
MERRSQKGSETKFQAHVSAALRAESVPYFPVVAQSSLADQGNQHAVDRRRR